MRGRRIRLTADHVIGHRDGRHCLLRGGEIIVEGERVIFAGHAFPGEVEEQRDYGTAIIAPGFIDLDALSDLDTTVLAFDNQPSWRKGRVWPRGYVARIPYEMYSPDELTFQKRYAFAQLLRNGITTALPIASLFYREWGETSAEFSSAAEAAASLGLRVYLGPAYRTGNLVVEDDGRLVAEFDEARGFQGLNEAIAFCRAHESTHGGLVRTMLSPDRIETCTAELLVRTAAAVRDLGVPVRLHCCQSKLEYDMVVERHGMSPPEWLASLGFLSPHTLLPHGTWVSGSRGVARAGRDLEIIRDGGATLVHCPLVSARGGRALESFARCRAMGLRIGMGTDTWPPDMVLNLQLGLMLCRVVDGAADAVRAEHLFDAATIGGADALGRGDLGRLQAGAAADIAVFDLSHDRVGQLIDPIQTLLIGGSGRDVRDVYVAGRRVVENGIIPGFDMAAAHRRAQAQFDGLVARYPERTFGHPAVTEIFSNAYPLIDAPTRPARISPGPASERPAMFDRLIHADWSISPDKRWAAVAEFRHGRWAIAAPAPIGAVRGFLEDAIIAARQQRLLMGFDFPIGVPLAYGSQTGFDGFRQWLEALDKEPWNQVFDVARRPGEIALTRPFYPLTSTKGVSPSELVTALKLTGTDDLLRVCDRRTPDRRAACAMFWTLGGNQVGKAALAGWKDVIRPAIGQGAALWPFEGNLAALSRGSGLVLAETYPAEAYRMVGAGFRPGQSKRRQMDRCSKASAILGWAERHAVVIAPELSAALRDGFGPAPGGEDAFDAVLGLLKMIEVADGRRNERTERHEASTTWEGWILGR